MADIIFNMVKKNYIGFYGETPVNKDEYIEEMDNGLYYEVKEGMKRKQVPENPTHILGYPIGAICVGRAGTKYENIVARIEFWPSTLGNCKTYWDWTNKRHVPIRYLSGNNGRGIEHKGQHFNSIPKIRFQEEWTVLESPPEISEPETIEI
jgi:hypothetical protein